MIIHNDKLDPKQWLSDKQGSGGKESVNPLVAN